jgi:hypothetical protein
MLYFKFCAVVVAILYIHFTKDHPMNIPAKLGKVVL